MSGICDKAFSFSLGTDWLQQQEYMEAGQTVFRQEFRTGLILIQSEYLLATLQRTVRKIILDWKTSLSTHLNLVNFVVVRGKKMLRFEHMQRVLSPFQLSHLLSTLQFSFLSYYIPLLANQRCRGILVKPRFGVTKQPHLGSTPRDSLKDDDNSIHHLGLLRELNEGTHAKALKSSTWSIINVGEIFF